MKNCPLPRLDQAPEVRERLLSSCRIGPGDVWTDDVMGHKVACIDAADAEQVAQLMAGQEARLAIHDPPYNLIAFEERSLDRYTKWCEAWVRTTLEHLSDDAALYVWLGADQNNGFQPLPDFMLMMRGISALSPRSFITMRNQRGYGTQHNWMAVRQELLYYVKGDPPFEVQYTDIPKILKGYYKEIDGQLTENLERGKSPTIRPGNVWVDIQQIFYRLEENVSGCYAQKPIKAIDRIVEASSKSGELVVDYFAHSGTTLISCERLQRRCFTADCDPLFCEITIRRLERFRKYGLLGWQNGNAFEEIVDGGDNNRADGDRAQRNGSQPMLF